MKVTYYGHSCFAVEVNKSTLLFDPFISVNSLASEIKLDSIKADFIIISHGHEDHIADAVALANQTNATVVSNWEIIAWLNKKGVTKTHPMNIGGKWMFDFGKLKSVAAEHSSSLPDGSYGGSPMGFIVESAEGNFYYAGDTALMYDMKLIGQYRRLDFAFLPIGDNFTMGIDNAIIAAEYIDCRNIIGMHYDTFEYIKIDKTDAVNKFAYAGKKLRLMNIGEVAEITN